MSSQRLYEVLGVSPQASQADIKKAYHRLALTCHPDKVGPQGEAQFKQISEANAILSDPQKRALYDRHGDAGLEYMNNDFAAPMMDQMGVQSFMLVGAVLVLFSSLCLLTTTSTIASKLDGHLESWSWGSTLFGLWVFEAVIMFVVVAYTYMLVHSLVVDRADSRVAVKQFVVPCIVALYFVATVLLGVNLDHHNMKWVVVAVPFIAADVFIAIASRESAIPQQLRNTLRIHGLVHFSEWHIYVLVACKIVSLFYRSLSALLIALRADDDIHGSYVACTIPIILYFVAAYIEAWVFLTIQMENNRAEGRNRFVALFGTLFLLGLLLASDVMMSLKASGSLPSWKASSTMIPLLILECSLVVTSCVMLCASGAMLAQSANSYSQFGEGNAPDTGASPA